MLADDVGHIRFSWSVQRRMSRSPVAFHVALRRANCYRVVVRSVNNVKGAPSRKERSGATGGSTDRDSERCEQPAHALVAMHRDIERGRFLS